MACDKKSPPRRGFRGGYNLYNGVSRNYGRRVCKTFGLPIRAPKPLKPHLPAGFTRSTHGVRQKVPSEEGI